MDTNNPILAYRYMDLNGGSYHFSNGIKYYSEIPESNREWKFTNLEYGKELLRRKYLPDENAVGDPDITRIIKPLYGRANT